MLLLFGLLVSLLGLMVVVAALVGAGRLVRREAFTPRGERRGHRWRGLAAVMVAGTAVGLVVWISAFSRDDVVVVDGTRTYCAASIGEDLPRPVVEQCVAQRHDRRMQALVAGVAAAAASAFVLWSAARGRLRPGMESDRAATEEWDGVGARGGSQPLGTE